MKPFTEQQKAVIAKRLGYEGPMEGFDDFIRSDPALEAKYATISDKYAVKMAKGGAVRKYADGGIVTHTAANATYTAENESGPTMQTALPPPPYRDPSAPPATTGNGTITAGPAPAPTNGFQLPTATMPGTPTPATVNPALIQENANQMMTYNPLGPAQTINAPAPVQTATAGMGAVAPVQTMDPTKTQQSITDALKGISAEQGTLSAGAIAGAAQGSVNQNMLATAQQGTSIDVNAPKPRTVQDGEMVSGTTVDQNRINEVMGQTQAEQGTVTEDMTVQGQMNKMLANFDAGNPPPWAAGAMRAATAQLAARGIGASSMAGQAIIQAAIEASMPIAAADAQTFKEQAFQNLSNRQQMALQKAQMRAQFLGQEFDQSFQTKVLNAAKISEIANMNFTAEQQIAIENARAANTMNLANLNNRQATVLANAATYAQMEFTNLNNRQQAQLQNAQAFLQMDMANLSNRQQTSLFKAQELTQSILTDAAAENASKQFNASSINQQNQFMTGLATQVSQFNATQQNAMAQFNSNQGLAVAQFNAEVTNQREQFNSQQRLVIDQANAQWRREISTANTAAINAANYLNAQNLQAVTMAEYNNKTQLYRDNISMAFTASENAANRATELLMANMRNSLAKTEMNYGAVGAIGNWLSKTDMGKQFGNALVSGTGELIKGGWDWLTSGLGPGTVGDLGDGGD